MLPSPTPVKMQWQNIHIEKNKEKPFKYELKKETKNMYIFKALQLKKKVQKFIFQQLHKKKGEIPI